MDRKVHSEGLKLAFVELFCDMLLTFQHVCANGRPICRFVRILSIGTDCRSDECCRWSFGLILTRKDVPETDAMCRQCPEIFLNIRTKSRSFCTNIRVNFLMFTSTFQLFFPSGCLFGSPCLRKAASES